MVQTNPMEQGGNLDQPGIDMTGGSGQTKGARRVVEAGLIKFALKYRDLLNDQGVCIQVLADQDGKEVELLRFDCFDQTPHYHYGPEKKNARYNLDTTTAGNPIGWTIRQLQSNLIAMLKHAGYEELAEQVNINHVSKKLDEVESIAREMALKERHVVTHNRGDIIVEAGVIRFGLEYRHFGTDQGLAIHVLGDVAGQEIELLAFDCFENEPHYHYGPRNKNIRHYWDKTATPDTLRWTLDQFKAKKLSAMIEKAGYPGIVAELDEGLIEAKLPEVETTALEMVQQNTR